MTSQEAKLIKSSRAIIIFGIILCVAAFILPNHIAPYNGLENFMETCTTPRYDYETSIDRCKGSGRGIAAMYVTADRVATVALFTITTIFVGIGVYQLRALKTTTPPNVIQHYAPVNMNTPPPPAPTSALDKRLAELQDLKARGIIDDGEYRKLLEKAISGS